MGWAVIVEQSPLTQGRELKCLLDVLAVDSAWSPLTQGRELKCVCAVYPCIAVGRPSRRGVN